MWNLKTILGILLLTMLGTWGAFFLKKVTISQSKLSIWGILKSPFLYLGGCCYVSAALLNIVLLHYIDYSILYPMTSLTYIWTTIWAKVTLDEKIDKNKILAIVLIIAGVFVLNI